MCKEWDNFQKFLEDMGPRPSGAHSLDRVDNSKGYYKENCRWATSIEQNNNTRSCIPITVNGRTLTLSQWAREFGVTRGVMEGKVRRYQGKEEAVAAMLAERIKPDEQ